MNLNEAKQVLIEHGYVLDEAEISGNWSKTLMERLVALQQRVKGLQLVKDKQKPYIIHVMMGSVHEVGYIETHSDRYDAEAVLIKNGKKIFMENGDYTAEEVFEEFKNEIERYIKMSESYRMNEREVNLNYLVKDIFELLTSYDIAASDDEVEKLVWNYIESGSDAEHASAEDVIEFDIDNDPDSVLKYNSSIYYWIKSGQYKTETDSFDESKKILENAGYIVEDTETDDEEYDELTDKIDKVLKGRKYSELSDKEKIKVSNIDRKRYKLQYKRPRAELKVPDAYLYNIKSLVSGVEEELKKKYNKVKIGSSDYDTEDECQIVEYYFTYKGPGSKTNKSYMLNVKYYNKDDVVKQQLWGDDWSYVVHDDFSVSTIDNAIEQIIKFVDYQVKKDND